MRTLSLQACIWLCAASAAHANVLEISDSGEAQLMTGAAILPPPADKRIAVGVVASEDPFETAARRYRIDPNLLRAVAWTESRGNNAAVSPKGARGIMQLMPATAAELGVDPSDPAANINGGAAYLAKQIATFHDVPLALAAYNAGPGAVIRYGGVPPYAETRGYVTKIMGRWQQTDTSGRSALPLDPSSPDKGQLIAAPPALPILLIEVPD